MHTALLELPPLVLPGLAEEIRPGLLGRVADQLANSLELLELVLAPEQWLALLQQLGQDAGNGPHIDRGAIFAVTHQQFGGPVPECDHLASDGLEGVFLVRDIGYRFSGLGRSLRSSGCRFCLAVG